MKLERVKKGDVLTVLLHVTDANNDGGIAAKVYGAGDTVPMWYGEAEVESMTFNRAEPIPAPAPKVLRYRVGDEVYRTWDHSDRGEVKAVNGDKYWVAFSNGLLLLTLTATDLVLI